MSHPRVKITYQDYLQLPEEQRYEVLEGDLRMVPAPGTWHQRVLVRIHRMVDAFVERHGLGQVYFAPVDVILDEDSVVQPDLLFVAAENLSIVKPEGVRGAPDLVVEVLSPSNAHRDRGVKRRLYGRYRVKEYWLVDPQERTVEICTLRGANLETISTLAEGAVIQPLLLPGLTIPVTDLFAP